MKAITVQQPWAWAIIHGGKNVENRTRLGTWRSAVGQRVAIHAGRRYSERGAESELVQRAYATWLGFTHWGGAMGGHTCLPINPHTEDRDAELIDLGAIIGTVEVVGLHLDAGCCAPWGESIYTEHGGRERIDIAHLVLEDPRPCEPVDCRGALGLWTVPDDIAALLETSVSA